MKKKCRATILFLMIFCMCFCFCGCSLAIKPSDDAGGTESGEIDADGFAHKVAFRPTTKAGQSMSEGEAAFYEVTTQYQRVAEALLAIINAKFNLQSNYDIENYLSYEIPRINDLNITIKNNPEPLHYDSIRYKATPVVVDGVQYVKLDDGKAWNWTVGLGYKFHQAYSSNIYQFVLDNGGSGYGTIDECFAIAPSIDDTSYKELMNEWFNPLTSQYFTQYTAMYSGLLEMAILDILMGEEPVNYQIAIDDDGTPMFEGIRLDANAYTDPWVEDERLAEIRQEKVDRFNRVSSYIGFMQSDIEKVVDYIFDSVIGQELVEEVSALYDREALFEDVERLLLSRDYGQGGEQIEDVALGGAESSAHHAYARAVFEDVEPGNYSISSGEDSFEHIEAREYSSFVLINSEVEALKALLIAFESDHDIEIKSYIRYYNNASKRLIECDVVDFNVVAGSFETFDDVNGDGKMSGDSNFVEISEECWAGNKYEDVELGVFDNNERLVATDEGGRRVSSFNRVYKTVDSKWGYGSVAVLDEQYATSDFFELVIDVKRDAMQPFGDYSFKFAILSYLCDMDRMQLG